MGKFEHVDALLKRFTETGGPAGVACAVAQNGKILYEGYHGLADLEQQKPITPETVFRLYSMTKVIVCTAGMMLYERGYFNLHDPLHEYIPEFKDALVYKQKENGEYIAVPALRAPRIQDAFTMSIGYPYPEWSDTPTGHDLTKLHRELASDPSKFTLQNVVRTAVKVPMLFEPGEHWQYGLGHDIVAALIEVVSGRTIGEFLQEEIFDPLGMKDTGYRFRGDIAKRMATVYEISPEGRKPATTIPFDAYHAPDSKYEGGGAGLYSTVRDYLTFSQMLANGGVHNGEKIIGRKTIDLMRTNYLNETQLAEYSGVPYHAGYGYGLGVRTLIDPVKANANSSLGEFGWSGMAGTWTSIDPSEGLSIVYMHQTFPHMEEYYHLRLRAAVYGCL